MSGTVSSFEVGMAELPPQCSPPPEPPAVVDPPVEQDLEVVIPLNANQVTVTFNPTFTYLPFVPLPVVEKPTTSSDDIFVTTVASVTTSGCIVFLSAPVPTTGYRLHVNVRPRFAPPTT